MGTHPIFESDFDCLTEMMNRSINLIVRRSIKQINKNVNDATPKPANQLTDGRNTLTKMKVAHFAGAKKSETLAYPEDAIIDVSNASEATHRTIAATNGELNGRMVRISEQTRNVMQSADKNANGWKIEFDTQERWENNTMGWGSSADPYSNTTSWLNFKTKEQAIQFAQRQGWEIEYVQENRRKKLEFRNYGDNFSWNKRLRKPAK